MLQLLRPYLYSVWVRGACALDGISKAASAGVDVQCVFHEAGLPTKEHDVERCVPTRRDYLRGQQVEGGNFGKLKAHLIIEKRTVKMERVAGYRQHLYA